jgi:hypothetical protein
MMALQCTHLIKHHSDIVGCLLYFSRQEVNKAVTLAKTLRSTEVRFGAPNFTMSFRTAAQQW